MKLLEAQLDERPFPSAGFGNFKRKRASTTPNNLQELPFRSQAYMTETRRGKLVERGRNPMKNQGKDEAKESSH